MGFRFSKRIKVLPGINLNFGLGGVSVSAGVPGARVTLSKRGLRGTVGIPGTGLSYSQNLSGSGRRQSGASSSRPVASHPLDNLVGFRLSLDERLEIQAELDRGQGYIGEFADKAALRNLKTIYSQRITDWLEQVAAEQNEDLSALSRMHETAPAPGSRFNQFVSFAIPQPRKQLPEALGLLDRLNPFANKRHREATEEAEANFLAECDAHEQARLSHDTYMKLLLSRQRKAFDGDEDAMSDLYSDCIAKIDWPRETLIDYGFSGPGVMQIKVDLPEIEDIPEKRYARKETLSGLGASRITQAERNRIYQAHIYGITARVIAEAFAVLPTLEQVVFSAYTQRRNSQGEVNDETVIALVVDRSEWKAIHGQVVSAPEKILNVRQSRIRQTAAGKLSKVEAYLVS